MRRRVNRQDCLPRNFGLTISATDLSYKGNDDTDSQGHLCDLPRARREVYVGGADPTESQRIRKRSRKLILPALTEHAAREAKSSRAFLSYGPEFLAEKRDGVDDRETMSTALQDKIDAVQAGAENWSAEDVVALASALRVFPNCGHRVEFRRGRRRAHRHRGARAPDIPRLYSGHRFPDNRRNLRADREDRAKISQDSSRTREIAIHAGAAGREICAETLDHRSEPVLLLAQSRGRSRPSWQASPPG